MNFRTYVCWYLINFYLKLGFWWAMLWDSQYSILLLLTSQARRSDIRWTCTSVYTSWVALHVYVVGTCTYAIVYTQVASPAPVPVLTVYVAVCLKARTRFWLWWGRKEWQRGRGRLASGGVFRTCARAAVVLDGGKGRKTVRRLRAWWGGQKRVWRGRVFIARRGRGLDGKKVYM